VTLLLILTLLLLCIIAYSIFYEIKSGKFVLFNPKNLFLFYFFLIFFVSTFYSIYFGTDPINLGLHSNIDIYIQAQILVNICLLFFLFGYHIKIPIINFQKKKEQLSLQKTEFLFIFSLIIGYSALFLFLVKQGGYNSFLLNRESWRSSNISGEGVYMFPATFLIFLSFQFYLTPRIKNFSRFKLLILTITILIPAYLIGFRSLMVIPIIQLLFTYHFIVKGFATSRLLSLSVIFLLFFTITALYRIIPKEVELSIDDKFEIISNNPEIIFNSINRVRGIEVLSTVMKKLDETHKHRNGFKIIYEAITIPIPHFLWSSKPESSGVAFTKFFFRENINYVRNTNDDFVGGTSPTIVGELFWHFGWFSIFIFFFIGIIYKQYFELIKKTTSSQFLFSVLIILVPSFIFFAEAIQGYLNTIVLISPFLLFYYFIFKLKLFK
jgi:oligosaccharide repeat unit polymerase